MHLAQQQNEVSSTSLERFSELTRHLPEAFAPLCYRSGPVICHIIAKEGCAGTCQAPLHPCAHSRQNAVYLQGIIVRE